MTIETKYNIGDKIKYLRKGIVYDGVIKGVYVEKRMRPKGAGRKSVCVDSFPTSPNLTKIKQPLYKNEI